MTSTTTARNDHPKIEIFGPRGDYLGTTTWAKTCKEAVANYRRAMGVGDATKITARFARDIRGAKVK